MAWTTKATERDAPPLNIISLGQVFDESPEVFVGLFHHGHARTTRGSDFLKGVIATHVCFHLPSHGKGKIEIPLVNLL
jgi:hypothetical protein